MKIDSDNSKEIYYKLNNNYQFFWNFCEEGIYSIKIKFKKKISSCAGLFYNCENITEINMSKFDCSNVLSCHKMFRGCKNLEKINLGELDFSLVNNFTHMFDSCTKLVNLDVTNFNTKNSESFQGMFYRMYNLRKINRNRYD